MNQLKTKSRFSTLLMILIGLSFLNTILLMFLPSYLNYSSIQSLSFNLNDGWCNQGQGIGIHCFGDFYYNFNFTNLTAPWSGNAIPYPPLTLFIFKIFNYILVSTSFKHLALNTYLLISVLSMLFPCFHLFRRKIINIKFSAILATVILMSSPMIMSFDRGNLQMIMTPFLYLCIYYFVANDQKRFLISSCFLIMLKPQYILLGMLLIPRHDLKIFIKWISVTSLTFFSTFLLYPKNLGANLKDYLNQIESFNHYIPLGSLYPANISLSSTLSLVYRFFTIDNPQNANRVDSFYIPVWATALFLVFCAILFWKKGQLINQYSLLYVVICFPLLLPGVTFGYHASSLVLFFVFVGVKIHKENSILDNQNSPSYFIENPITFVLTSLITSLLFIPWSIPWNIFTYYKQLPDGNVTITWTILQLLIFILLVKIIINIFSLSKDKE